MSLNLDLTFWFHTHIVAVFNYFFRMKKPGFYPMQLLNKDVYKVCVVVRKSPTVK